MPTVVTAALPYANGPIHLGHLVEYIQTDIFCRFLKMTGDNVIYVCASDTHGAPIELKSRELKITPEELVEKIHHEHLRDFKAFQVDFDIFYTTNSKENQKHAEYIYGQLKEKNFIIKKTVPARFCEHDGRFLPDRYIRGNCPKCGAPNQYGDSCEACGATYEPADLKNPICSLCGKTPVVKNSEHLFFQLEKCRDFLLDWVTKSGALQEEVANSVLTWIREGLKDWCISRDGPYFGFPIPGEANKFFYVWLDAPIGYISSTEKYCNDHKIDFAKIWRKKEGTVYHFIGKDIVYFHVLFWPAMLSNSGYNLPKNIFVHGFLTVNGEKMSKSRGTFITAQTYLSSLGEKNGSSYLRYYYASKLTSRTEDLDLNLDDFRFKVNAGLVNNICNFHNRTFTFCLKQLDGQIGTLPKSHFLLDAALKTVQEAEQHFRHLEYNRAIEKINLLSDEGNRFFQDSAPWDTVKTDREKTLTHITLCVNLVKVLGVMLKPVLPLLVCELEKQLGLSPFTWQDAKMNLENSRLQFVDKLSIPIEAENASKMILKPAESEKPATRPNISYEDFSKMDLRVATVLKAEAIPNTRKLLKLQIQTGDAARTLVAGIAENYKAEDLIGTQVVIVANLEPAKIRGIVSEGMILAAQDKENLIVIRPEKTASNGSKVA